MDFHDYSLLSTGLSADAEVDELIRKTCGDADVFVYVCNGTSTLEEPVIMQMVHIGIRAWFPHIYIHSMLYFLSVIELFNMSSSYIILCKLFIGVRLCSAVHLIRFPVGDMSSSIPIVCAKFVLVSIP